MNESWKDIEGYEGLYMVSDLGRVKSLKLGKERILKPGKDRGGYLSSHLWKDGNCKWFLVHRLVANAFIPNPNNRQQVNHKDENKENNTVYNLEWCDSKYNVNYGTGMRRMLDSRTGPGKEKQVICVETNKVYISSNEAERQTGINHSSIIKCCKGKLKTAGKLHWQYAELTNS